MLGFASFRGWVLPVAVLSVALAGLTGCGSSSAKPSIVEGKVTVDGAPANSGMVMLTAGGKSISGNIQPDGTYRVVDAPKGAAQVTVTGSPNPGGAAPTTGMPGMGTGPSGSPVPIPAKYAKVETSGLTITVNAGTNKFDIALTK